MDAFSGKHLDYMNVVFPPVLDIDIGTDNGQTVTTYAPWSDDLNKLKTLNDAVPQDQNAKETIEAKRWLVTDKRKGIYKELDPHVSYYEQINHRKYQYIVGVNENGPYTSIIKSGKQVGYKGPDDKLHYFSYKHKVLERFSRASRRTKCAIITGIVLCFGSIIAAIATPLALYNQCKRGTRTGQVCVDLQVQQTDVTKGPGPSAVYTTQFSTALMCGEHLCANGGTCSINSDKIVCKCDDRYTGERCQDNKKDTTQNIMTSEESEMLTEEMLSTTKNTHKTPPAKTGSSAGLVRTIGTMIIIAIGVVTLVLFLIGSRDRDTDITEDDTTISKTEDHNVVGRRTHSKKKRTGKRSGRRRHKLTNKTHPFLRNPKRLRIT